MNLPKVKMLQVSKCLIGLAVMMLQSCDVADNRRDMLCGNWESVEGKPDVLIYKEGEAYKVTVFRRSGLRRKLKPETYLLQAQADNHCYSCSHVTLDFSGCYSSVGCPGCGFTRT